MKIGLDARNLLPNQTGIGRCVYNLISNLAKLDSENEYIVFKRPEYKFRITEAENFREILVPDDPSSFRSCGIGYREINDLNLDVYHTFFHLIPGNLKAKKIIVTLHDLMWIDSPELVFDDYFRQKFIQCYGKVFIKRALNNADSIVAISNFTKQQAIKTYGISTDKIQVIYNGIDNTFYKLTFKEESNQNSESYKYIFSLGHTRPYKNIFRVIEAFKQISEEFKDINLVIAGRGDYEIKLKKLASNYKLGNRVIFVGRLPDKVLVQVFKKAQFLVFPSLIEGFGLPVVEAMALGCPVLASDIPVFKEIGGDAYEKVDPYNVDSIARGMRRLLRYDEYRNCLRVKGYERAKLYSWEDSAKKLITLFSDN